MGIIHVNAKDKYQPFAEQKLAHKALAKYRYVQGGFGSGKTKWMVWEVIDNCMRFQKGRWLIARDTVQDLEDSTKHDFFEECPPELILSYRKKLNQVIMQNGSEIIFRSFRGYNPSSHTGGQKAGIKALNLSGFAIDEASETVEDHFKMLKGRLRLHTVPNGHHRGIMVSNPPEKTHWLYKTFSGHSDITDLDVYMMIIPTYSNPYLPADYIPNLEKDYDPSWIARYLKGEFGFVLRGDPVYTNFKENLNGMPWHVGETTFVRGRPVYRDWDFGWHHPAVVWSQNDLEGRWRIHKELMGEKVYIQDFAPKVIEISNKLFVGAEFIDYCDPAGKQRSDKNKRSTVQILEDDFRIRPTSRFSWVHDGILIIQGKLNQMTAGEPNLRINKDGCPIIYNGFLGGYARGLATDGKQMTSWEPIKDGYYEHPMDALRMGAINRFGANSQHSVGNRLIIGNPTWGTQVSR